MTYYHEILKRKNSRKYTPIKEFNTEEEVLNYLNQNNLKFNGTPYIFTHIKLNDGSIISQKYKGFMCSPTKLRDILGGLK